MDIPLFVRPIDHCSEPASVSGDVCLTRINDHGSFDARNARSRAAMAKLGAVEEGIIRRHKITWTGHKRDSVLFSIIAEEWPQVRDRLAERLA
jgi:hypothetical protein